MNRVKPRLKRQRRWLRRSAIVAALLLLLLMGNALHAHLDREPITLSGDPGDLLYAAAFDGYLDEWDLYAGQQSASIVAGRLQLALSQPQTATWSAARPSFADFDAQAQASAIAGPIDNAYGIVFALRGGEDKCDLPALILCGIDGWIPALGAAMRLAFAETDALAYFAFLISSDGYYSLIESRDGQRHRLSDWIPSAAIQQGIGARNAIRVIRRGSTIQFFINGQLAPLCVPDDPADASTFVNGDCLAGSMQDKYRAEQARAGRLGFIAQATQTGGGGVIAEFDRLLVFQPAISGSEDSKA